MKLLDKYVTEVGKHLPRKNRTDIETEIRSTLQDMLDERSANTGKPVDDALTIEVLKEYGAPAKVAESYRGAQYLVGPRLYPIFEMVVKIVMAALLGAGLLGYAFSGTFVKAFAGPEFFSFLGQFWLGLLGGMISAFGNIVIVFAILERVLPNSELEKNEAENWDPSELAAEEDPDQVKISDMIATVVFTAIGLAIFNLYPDLIGFGFVTDGKWTFVPALSDAFFAYLPWINLLGVLEIVFSLYMLREGAWKTATRIVNLLLEAGSVALAIVMLSGPALLDLSVNKLANTPLAESAAVLTPIFNFVPAIVLVVIIIISAIEIVQTVLKLIKGKPAPFVPVSK